MRVTLFESISLNGMMGRPDGRGDFFTDVCWTGFVEAARQTGAMIWGRTTHDLLRRSSGAAEQLSGVTGVVLTSRTDYDPGPGWQTGASPREALDVLARAGVDATLVVGGQTVNTAFLRDGLIDELVLFVESVVVGRGMPLFAASDHDLRLSLVETRRESESVVRLHYHVVR